MQKFEIVIVLTLICVILKKIDSFQGNDKRSQKVSIIETDNVGSLKKSQYRVDIPFGIFDQASTCQKKTASPEIPTLFTTHNRFPSSYNISSLKKYPAQVQVYSQYHSTHHHHYHHNQHHLFPPLDDPCFLPAISFQSLNHTLPECFPSQIQDS